MEILVRKIQSFDVIIDKTLQKINDYGDDDGDDDNDDDDDDNDRNSNKAVKKKINGKSKYKVHSTKLLK